MIKFCLFILLAFPLISMSGCSREVVGGAALGAGAAGAVYEYSNKERLEDLENDYKSGRIDREEYLRRKKEIEDKSLVY